MLQTKEVTGGAVRGAKVLTLLSEVEATEFLLWTMRKRRKSRVTPAPRPEQTDNMRRQSEEQVWTVIRGVQFCPCEV